LLPDVEHLRERRRKAARRRRTLSAIAVVGALTAVTATALAVREYILAPDPVLEVDDAYASSTPNTLPTDAADVDRRPPKAISIDDIDMWGEVTTVGIEDDGELEVPDETEVGWYKYGSAPGLPGATVLAAHVTWNHTTGPFFRLGTLDPGAHVDVRAADGELRTYEVVERTMYPKDELPIDRIWRTTGSEVLVLITCGGSYNPDIRRYRDNIVVYAVPVASAPESLPTDESTTDDERTTTLPNA
jgi:hypothetical protein